MSEQKPNDGGYHIKRLVGEANNRLGRIGRHGKRAKIVAKRNSLTLQFSFEDGTPNKQKNVGLGAIPFSARGIEEAENIAQLVTGQLVASTFTWEWFNSLIGKDTSEKAQVLTCREMVEQYKKHFFKQQRGNKIPESNWYGANRMLERVIGDVDKPISLSLVREVIESTENNSDTRKTTLQGIVGFLKYFNNTDYKGIIKEYKANNKITRKKRNVPSDKKIAETYKTGFEINSFAPKRHRYRLTQWQFLYGLLATYGLRIHEAWNIANWDKPVTLKNGDWVVVADDSDEDVAKRHGGEDLVIPAILDPTNKNLILCVKHNTKTGYRMAMPLSPEGHDWVQEFNLLQSFNLPDMPNPLKKAGKTKGSYRCTTDTGRWFSRREYGFTPHDLRHAYNHRGHRLGININTLCQSLGHGYEMNTTTYSNSKSDQVKLQDMLLTISKDKEQRSELEVAREEIEALKADNQALKNENELLKAKIQIQQTFDMS